MGAYLFARLKNARNRQVKYPAAGRLSGQAFSFLPFERKRAKIAEGIGFYNAVKDVVRDGDIAEISCNIRYYRDPKGCQIYKKISRDKSRLLILAHYFERPHELFEADVSGYKLAASYTTIPFDVSEGRLRLRPEREYRAGAFLFEKV